MNKAFRRLLPICLAGSLALASIGSFAAIKDKKPAEVMMVVAGGRALNPKGSMLVNVNDADVKAIALYELDEKGNAKAEVAKIENPIGTRKNKTRSAILSRRYKIALSDLKLEDDKKYGVVAIDADGNKVVQSIRLDFGE